MSRVIKDDTKNRNSFGSLSSDYDKVRRGYPDSVFSYLIKRSRHLDGVRTLDLGCGTGISTRELHVHGFDAVGIDKEEKMVSLARSKHDKIRYEVGSAKKLPFPEGSFDVVTAFTSFHWFDDATSVENIIRVLKPEGLLFTVLKLTSEKSHKGRKCQRDYWRMLNKYGVYSANDPAVNHRPYLVLRRHGFTETEKRHFYAYERYTVKEAVGLSKTLSSWNLIPEERRHEYLKEVEALYGRNLTAGKLVRRREFTVVSGFNPGL